MPATRPSDRESTARLATASPAELLLAEFIHRSANDFAAACAEIGFAARLPTLSAVQDRFGKIAARLHALASIQRLLQPPREPSFDLGNLLCELCHHHADARFAEQGAFVRLRTCEATVDATQGWALLMIVSELLTNAARHAFDGPGGMVRVEIARIRDTILCQVADNGVGRTAQGRGRQMGTAIVEELARTAGIDFRVSPQEQGTRFELRLGTHSAPNFAGRAAFEENPG